jgi:hypothetical protein
MYSLKKMNDLESTFLKDNGASLSNDLATGNRTMDMKNINEDQLQFESFDDLMINFQ